MSYCLGINCDSGSVVDGDAAEVRGCSEDENDQQLWVPFE